MHNKTKSINACNMGPLSLVIKVVFHLKIREKTGALALWTQYSL